MAAVGFAIGSRPGVSEIEAFELAELLERRRSLASFSAAKKIREQAGRDPDREVSQDCRRTDRAAQPTTTVR
jgi:hypothetical protein